MQDEKLNWNHKRNMIGIFSLKNEMIWRKTKMFSGGREKERKKGNGRGRGRKRKIFRRVTSAVYQKTIRKSILLFLFPHPLPPQFLSLSLSLSYPRLFDTRFLVKFSSKRKRWSVSLKGKIIEIRFHQPFLFWKNNIYPVTG